MRTRRLRRWVVGLCAAGLLGIGSIAIAHSAYADNSWGVMTTPEETQSGR
jgi:hypothetical protein